MLELLISLRRSGGEGPVGGSSTSMKQAGYIVAAKKSPAVWGSMERRFMLVTLLDDTALEMEFAEREVWINPLARYDMVNDIPAILERGCFRVDLSMFTGTEGLDASVEVSQPTPPNGLPALRMKHLIYDDPLETDNTAVLLDCTGKKSALAQAMLSDVFSVTDRIVFTKNNKVWRHGTDIPAGRTAISLDAVTDSVMAHPSAADLVAAGIPRAVELDARYVLFGRTSDLPGIVTTCLLNNIIPIRPLLDYSEEAIVSECGNLGISFENTSLEVEGQIVNHSVVE